MGGTGDKGASKYSILSWRMQNILAKYSFLENASFGNAQQLRTRVQAMERTNSCIFGFLFMKRKEMLGKDKFQNFKLLLNWGLRKRHMVSRKTFDSNLDSFPNLIVFQDKLQWIGYSNWRQRNFTPISWDNFGSSHFFCFPCFPVKVFSRLIYFPVKVTRTIRVKLVYSQIKSSPLSRVQTSERNQTETRLLSFYPAPFFGKMLAPECSGHFLGKQLNLKKSDPSLSRRA